MANPALPGDCEDAQGDSGNAPPAIEVAAYGLDLLRASDGDGGMLGRVLIYAVIITVVIAVIMWKQLL